MGEVSIRKKMGMVSAVLIALIAAMAAYTLYLFGTLDSGSVILRDARITFHALEEQIAQGNLEALEDYRGVYIGNDGYVMKSTVPAYQEGSYAGLMRFSSVDGLTQERGKKYYEAPVLKSGVQVGTLIVELEAYKKTVFYNYGLLPFLPLFAIALAIIMLLILERRLQKRDVFDPVDELLAVTQKIRSNDFTTPISYDYGGEIGSLCHEVEALRDELAFAKKNGERLKKNEKELLACISHDLKTPLSSVSGYVEGIRSRVVTEQERIDRYLDIVIQKVKFISKLIDDILEQSKAELNEFPVVLDEVYASELFREIFNDLSMDVIKAGYTFTCGNIPDVMVYADRQRITQVLQNIISNAMKYTPDGGSIHAELGVYGRELVISIKDNGRGIAVNDQPFIFDKFYRGEKERNMDVPGSGLGLAIARYIVECHGGSIECDSILEEGTVIRFSVRLC